MSIKIVFNIFRGIIKRIMMTRATLVAGTAVTTPTALWATTSTCLFVSAKRV